MDKAYYDDAWYQANDDAFEMGYQDAINGRDEIGPRNEHQPEYHRGYTVGTLDKQGR